jgi:hypothetical protein
MLGAGFGGFFHRFLGLLLCAYEENLTAFAAGGRQKLASRLQLAQSLAQINDVDPIARVEDELLHLGIPTPGLMSEVYARLQQFFKTNAKHVFPLLSIRSRAEHPAEDGIEFSVVVAGRVHLNPTRFQAVSGLRQRKRAPFPNRRDGQASKGGSQSNLYFPHQYP